MTVARFNRAVKAPPVFNNKIGVYFGSAWKIFDKGSRGDVTVNMRAYNHYYIRYIDGCEWSTCGITDNGCTDNCGKESFLIKKLH